MYNDKKEQQFSVSSTDEKDVQSQVDTYFANIRKIYGSDFSSNEVINLSQDKLQEHFDICKLMKRSVVSQNIWDHIMSD